MPDPPGAPRNPWPEGISGQLLAAYRYIFEASSEHETATRATEVAREIFGADLTWCALATGDSLVGAAFSGWRHLRPGEPFVVPMGEGIGGRVLVEGRTTIVRNYLRDPRRISWLKARLDDEEVRVGYVAPFAIGDRPGGVLYVSWRSARALCEEEAADVTTYARDVGAFLFSARQREAAAGHLAREHLLDQFAASLASRASLAESLRMVARELDIQISLGDIYGHESLVITPEDRSHNSTPEATLTFELGGQLGVLRLSHPAGLSPGDEQTARQVARLVALELHRERGIAETQDRLSSRFVEDLVTGGDSADNLLRHAGLLGVDLRRPRAVAFVGIHPGPGSQHDRTPRQTGRRWIDGLLRVVRTRHRDVLCAERDGGVVLVLESDSSDQALKDYLAATIAGVTTVVGSGLCAGLGRTVHIADDFPESFDEARAAFTVATSRSAPGAVLAVADLGLHGLLLQAVRPGALHSLVESTLGPLMGSAGQGRAQLLRTLSCYFDHDCSQERTAAHLGIHSNTLRYRLARIEEVVDLDLHEPGGRFRLELAVRTWQILEEPSRP